MSCTPPSRVTPSAWNLKRASRTGPLDCTKNGGVLCAPAAVAMATSGSWAGGGSCADSVAVWMLTTHMNANSTGADMNRDFFQIIDPPLDRRYASAAGGDMHHRRDGG